jgi:MATE family multidrug resistance protein
MIWHLPATFIFMVLRQLVTGLSKPVVITIITAAAVPANLALNLVLVFGWLGLPALGVAGSGLATSIVAWLKLAAMIVYIVRQPQLMAFGPFRRLFGVDRAMWRQLLRLGMPVAGVRMIEGSMSQATTFLMGFFGAGALAAHSVLTSVAMLSGSIAVGFGHGASVRVAQEFGGGRRVAAVRAGWFGAVGVVAVVTPVALLLCLLPDAITSLLLDPSDPANAEAFQLVRDLRWVAALFLVVQAAEVVMSRALRGFKDVFVPMLLSAVGFLAVGIPAGWLMAFPLDGGPLALWAGMALGFAVTGAALLLRWRRMGRGA